VAEINPAVQAGLNRRTSLKMYRTAFARQSFAKANLFSELRQLFTAINQVASFLIADICSGLIDDGR
jgi:hypothetical protein